MPDTNMQNQENNGKLYMFSYLSNCRKIFKLEISWKMLLWFLKKINFFYKLFKTWKCFYLIYQFVNTLSGKIFFGIEIQNIWDPLGTSLNCVFTWQFFSTSRYNWKHKVFEAMIDLLFSGMESMITLIFLGRKIEDWAL